MREKRDVVIAVRCFKFEWEKKGINPKREKESCLLPTKHRWKYAKTSNFG